MLSLYCAPSLNTPLTMSNELLINTNINIIVMLRNKKKKKKILVTKIE